MDEEEALKHTPTHPDRHNTWPPGFSKKIVTNKHVELYKVNDNCCKLEAPYIYKKQLTKNTAFITTTDNKA